MFLNPTTNLSHRQCKSWELYAIFARRKPTSKRKLQKSHATKLYRLNFPGNLKICSARRAHNFKSALLAARLTDFENTRPITP